MEKQSYREIIRFHIREAMRKKAKAKNKKEEDRWFWVIENLMHDLADYEGRGSWLREPRDKAWKRYSRASTSHFDRVWREFLRDFFGDDTWF
jgi:hypothetical protein